MTAVRDVLKQLEALGSEQTRKTWRRHGISEPMFGVKYGDLYKLRKQLGRDHGLACALWQTGNHDARVLAAMIADPAAFDAATLRQWQAASTCRTQDTTLITYVAAEAPGALEVLPGWLNSAEEGPRRAGWTLVTHLAKEHPDLEDSFFAPLLTRLEREIHQAPNWVREAMNWTLIGLGARSDALAKLAVAAARRIGPVDVDHGDTCCETPDAITYIPKAREHRAKQEAKAAAKKPRKAAATPAAAGEAKTAARTPAASKAKTTSRAPATSKAKTTSARPAAKKPAAAKTASARTPAAKKPTRTTPARAR